MTNIDKLIDTFVTGDYFIIFLVITFVTLIMLVVVLIKSREEYKELLKSEEKELKQYVDTGATAKEVDILDELDLLATKENDVIDKDKPLIKQIDTSDIKTNIDLLDEYENEEDNAVISAEELERKAKERLDTLGLNENQEAIQKYEEEQENKAIISYEQLLKNASKISLSYIDEPKEKGAPKVKKIEVEEKEVSGPEIYLEEEEFLKILKEFRINLE